MELVEYPQQMACFLTDNAYLQKFYETLLFLKDEAERRTYEMQFWDDVDRMPGAEQAAIRRAYNQLSQKLSERTGSILDYLRRRNEGQVVLA